MGVKNSFLNRFSNVAPEVNPRVSDAVLAIRQAGARDFERKIAGQLPRSKERSPAGPAASEGAGAGTEFLARVAATRRANPKLSKGEAVNLVARADPGLHERYISESQPIGARDENGRPIKERDGTPIADHWDGLIAEMMVADRNLSKAQAIRALATRNPQLHDQYLQEATDSYARRRGLVAMS